MKAASLTLPVDPVPAVPPEEETEYESFEEEEVEETPQLSQEKAEPKEEEVEEVPMMEKDKMCLTIKSKGKPPQKDCESSGEYENVQGWKKKKRGRRRHKGSQF